jgi:hypothetical protein
MQTEHLIAVKAFCISHNIEISFLHSLQRTGLIDIIMIQESAYIDAEQLPEIEKIIRYYFDLDINLEGIESIIHLLQRIRAKDTEIMELKNKLRLYEAEVDV